MKLHAAGKTDVGRSRSHNEDDLLVLTESGLFAVCDGLGGHNAGEVASRIAVETIEEVVTGKAKPGKEFHPEASPEARLLGWAVRTASMKIHAEAQSSAGRTGMGTTATAAWFHGRSVSFAQVGDSRAYLFRNGSLEQVTQDHSFVAEQVRAGLLSPEEARQSLHKNIITRALGVHADVQVDVYEQRVRAGDTYVLCSDGLTAVLSDTKLREMVASKDEPEALCSALIDEANARGGPDNITAVVIYIMD